MAVSAGKQEAGGNGVGILRGLVALRALAILVNEPRPFGPEAVFFAFEKPEVVCGQQAAFDAA